MHHRHTVCALLAALALCASRPALATAQEPDEIIYQGKKQQLLSVPLWTYPVDKKRPLFKPEVGSTGCWRGYNALWEVKQGALWLRGLYPCGGMAISPRPLPWHGPKLPLRATWFSGSLRLPQGKLLRYVHVGHASIYERALVLYVVRGKIVRHRLFDNRADKRAKLGQRPSQDAVARSVRALHKRARACLPRAKAKRARLPRQLSASLWISRYGAPQSLILPRGIVTEQRRRVLYDIIGCVHASATQSNFGAARYRYRVRLALSLY
ncbi:MAG: hypothetical protein KC503_19940 [Myxococcales bacterium]|nr:hypothetical protein [Myxococcales bacterium]